ncbi:HPP family-domain-containing protein [Podospora conica]|nr:HPP family-domain-containing protein [Schizothecium conicum]
MPFDHTRPFRWHLDIDRHLNPILPPSILPRLPHPVAHFLGYRSHPSAQGALGNVAVVFWACIGIFSSLAVIGAATQHVPAFQNWGVPTIIGSFGAAAVLDFYAIESPLAQPRNAIIGQLVSALVGVATCKLFMLSPHFDDIRWLGASFACAMATAAMGLTGTIHPPAGATALMAVLDDNVSALGWFLVAPVMLGCGLMLTVALLINNIQRRFPYYWWSPEETGRRWKKQHHHQPGKHVDGPDPAKERDLEKEKELEQRDTKTSGTASASGSGEGDEEDTDLENQTTVTWVEGERLVVSRNHVTIPKSMYLTYEEKILLETLSQRLS